MNKISKYSWYIVIPLATIPFAYFLLRLAGIPILAFLSDTQDKSFLDSAMGNWFATMVGLIAGVPIGLWINKRQQEIQEAEKITLEIKIKYEHKRNVLSLLKEELLLNQEYLIDLIREQEGKPKITILAGMKNVLWLAFSDSGELQWIDNPSLINVISNAYYHINALIEFERRYSEPSFNMSVTRGRKQTFAGENAVNNVKALRPVTLKEISDAIKAIEIDLQ